MKRLSYLIIFIVSLSSCFDGKYDSMRTGLDSLNMLNKADSPFSVEDVEPFVTYFNDHGTPNDQMLAYYLLGRAYHEQHEAPVALKYYQKALEQCDTSVTDCDYGQLSRVYAQMGSVFYQQSLYREHLRCFEKAAYYAWESRDTLTALACYEQEALAYKRLDKNDSALAIYYDIAYHYSQMGKSQDEAMTLGGTINILIESGQNKEARKMMALYETSSGLFDEHGNIEHGREIYYFLKGSLYLNENMLDSAEYWFRKELQNANDYNNQHGAARGLALVYDRKNLADSAARYYSYAYAMNDSIHANQVFKEIKQAQEMYDYTRHQAIAQQESLKSQRLTGYVRIGGFVILTLLLIIYIINYHLKQRIKQKHQQYLQCLQQIEEAQTDLLNLRSEEKGKDLVIAQKEKTISVLQEELNLYQRKKTKGYQEMLEAQLIASPIYQRFTFLSTKGQLPTDEEWKEIRIIAFDLFPQFHQLLLSKSHSLNINEYNACVLIRLHFKPSDLCNMLSISSAYANKLRRNLLQKLFSRDGKAEDFDHLITAVF